ncbi:CheR family methyltransferase [Halobacteriovorax sp. HLS]|uniref:CheR family methyltransferase n=1 Tax=Halobacteriovorax sp. HLS TaxID=2234000 RepID=UPI000FDB176B|nr:CheR family methyltransferase [Halobacteriovorax sp. HLS]
MGVAKSMNEDPYEELVEKVSGIVARISGNVLGEKQSLMVQTRIKKRMSELGLSTPEKYIAYIDSHKDKESGVLVSLLTTHHTFFFREFTHFEHLKENLPRLISNVKARGENTLKIWSAACSRGQEVYSLSMFLNFYLPKLDPTMKFTILGSDIDPESVKIGANGVYHRREIKSVPMNYLGDNWARGTGEISEFVKAKKSISNNCTFKVYNLLNFHKEMGSEIFDVIFCRNVFIYFKSHQIEEITNNFFKHLHETGLFYSGISESLGGLNLDIANVGPSVYAHKVEVVEPSAEASTPAAAPLTPAVSQPKLSMPSKLRVFSIDDSSSILTLLKKVFSTDDFEVVGTACNGIDARNQLKDLKGKVDVVTLDIHMPEMDGVTYLETYHDDDHPPVVVISSASREDSDAAMRCLRAGAADFIEKPALNNLMERGEEIKTKLRVAYIDKNLTKAHVSTIDKAFEKEVAIEKVEEKFRVIVSSLSDQKKVVKYFHELHGKQPATLMLFEGQDNLLAAIQEELSDKLRFPVEILDSVDAKLEPGKVYLADFKKAFKPAYEQHKDQKSSILVFGQCSSHSAEQLLEWSDAQLLIEDVGVSSSLNEVATDIVPTTSFAYMSSEYLSRD